MDLERKLDNEHLKEYGIVDLADGRIVFSACHNSSKEENLRIIRDLDKDTKERRNALLKFRDFNKKLGGFYFMVYTNSDILFGDIGEVCNEDLPKLLYLASFLDYEDRNGNKICKNRANNVKTPMPKKEVFKLLGFSSTNKSKIWFERMEKLGLLYIYEDYVELNEKYFVRGKQSNLDSKYTRIYVNTIRELYINNDMRKHRQLGLILRLLPLMNINSNIICRNPGEINGANVHKMDRYDIAKILNVSDEKRNLSKMIRSLITIKVHFENYELQVFKFVTVSDSDDKREFFVVNPILSYKGNNYDELMKVLKTYFFEEKDIKVIE